MKNRFYDILYSCMELHSKYFMDAKRKIKKNQTQVYLLAKMAILTNRMEHLKFMEYIIINVHRQ